MRHIIKILSCAGLLVASAAFGSPAQTQRHLGQAKTVEGSQVPDLPFPDNLDPSVCGIPQRWGSRVPAQLTGFYGGELVQPVVFLYDSHSRRAVTGRAQSGAKVRVLLFQSNPTLSYYLVRTLGKNPQEGWVPAPFLKLASNL